MTDLEIIKDKLEELLEMTESALSSNKPKPNPFKDFLVAQKLTVPEFKRKYNPNASLSALYMWERGERTPKPDAQENLDEITNGEIRKGSFYWEL